MPIKLEELLKRLPSDIKERVFRTQKRFNNNIRDALRQETGLKLNRDTQNAPSETVNVPITLMPGLPSSLSQKSSLPDDIRRVALLAPYTQILRELRNGCDTLLGNAHEWHGDRLLTSLFDENEQSLGDTKTLAELLLKEAERLNLIRWILEVNEDVLGVYRYSYSFYSESQGIELYWGVVGLVARWLGVPVEDLTVVVMTHELAHAYTHLGMDIDGERWPTPHFMASDRCVKEGLAQYYTVRVLGKLQAAGTGPMEAYHRLLPDQPPAYQVHVPWVQGHTPEMVRAAMLQIRRYEKPVLDDFTHLLHDARTRLRQM